MEVTKECKDLDGYDFKIEDCDVIFNEMGYLGVLDLEQDCYMLKNPNGVIIYVYDINENIIEEPIMNGMDKVFTKHFNILLNQMGVFND